ALKGLWPRRDTTAMRQNWNNDLRGLLNPEIGCLSQRNLLITPKIADAEDIGLQRLDPRQQCREIGGADRVAKIPEIFDVECFADLKEAAHHFVSEGLVRGTECDLLDKFRERVASDRARRHMGVQRLVKGKSAEVGHLVDR